jgi:hypothetical protein
VLDSFADVKGEQQNPARTQHALKFRQGRDDRLARQIDDGVEGRDAAV